MITAPAPAIASLSVILTDRCNLDCAYCYRGGSGSGRDLAEDDLGEALTLALKTGNPELEVVFSGGEPVLRFDVFRRAVECLRGHASAAGTITVRLISNGTLLSDERIEFLVEHDVCLNLSLDGSPQAQQLRGAGTIIVLDRLLERLRLRHRSYLANRVEAVMTLLPTTVHCLAASVDHLLAAGIRKIGVSPALIPVPGWDDDLRPELAAQLTAIRRRCEEILATTGEVPFLPLRRDGPEPGPDETDAGSCRICSGAGPVVDTDGRLYSCLMFAPSGLGTDTDQAPLRRVAAAIDLGRPDEHGYEQRVGNLPAALAALPGFASQRELSSRIGACATCHARASCSICPYALLRFKGDGDGRRVPAFICAFHQEVARQRALIPAQPPTGMARWRPEVIEARRTRLRERLRSR